MVNFWFRWWVGVWCLVENKGIWGVCYFVGCCWAPADCFSDGIITDSRSGWLLLVWSDASCFARPTIFIASRSWPMVSNRLHVQMFSVSICFTKFRSPLGVSANDMTAIFMSMMHRHLVQNTEFRARSVLHCWQSGLFFWFVISICRLGCCLFLVVHVCKPMCLRSEKHRQMFQ